MKKDKTLRTEITPIRYSPNEMELIEDAMKEIGQDKSKFIRNASLEKANKVLVKME